MPTPTIKQLQKFYNDEILKDTSISMDNVIEVTSSKAGIAPETVKDALIGNAKLNPEVLVKIFEALGIKMQEDEPCPGGMERLPNGECPPPAEPATGESKGGKPIRDTVKEQIDSTFGSDDLGNRFNEVLKLIKETKDTETAKYLSEIFRKVFETIPAIIKAEQGDKVSEYAKKVDGFEKDLKESNKKVEELQAAMKKVPKLTEALTAAGKLKLGKGLYEQGTKGNNAKKNTLEEMSLTDLSGREAVPNFND